jgi:tetratricopeptide (TPR) repeat protein
MVLSSQIGRWPKADRRSSRQGVKGIRLWASLSAVLLGAIAIAGAESLTAERVIAQTVGDPAPVSTPSNVEPLSPTVNQNGLFNVNAGKRLMSEATSAVNAQNYPLAASKLQEARQLMNQLSNFYQGLGSTFLGVDTVVSDSLRRKALESAQIRDDATYQLALVYRAQGQADKAIPLLIEIVRSQNPSRDLGQKSYRQLWELGFVDVAYPRQSATPEKK